ncbi:MAG: 50S ribosomal protein L3 [candidate division Zixibacteria bacterium]|nr:50S ribosomal protein L3 [candidate division Zixibacteria bacterium]
MNGLIGKKLGMTQIMAEDGQVVPVTVIEAGPCFVTQVKTQERDGYRAVQLGFSERKKKGTTRPIQGHFEKAGITPQRILREFRVEDTAAYTPGQTVGAGVFSAGQRVSVTGISKGLGFQGVVRRHHFRGGEKTRGQSDRMRAPGSIGASSSPSRVYKGTRMAGHMGNERVTVKNLRVVRVDEERNLLLLEGAVPGHENAFVVIKRA